MDVDIFSKAMQALPKSLRAPRGRSYHKTPHNPAYGSALQARLVVCGRMNSKALLARIRRGKWSGTSEAAARQVLADRGVEVM